MPDFDAVLDVGKQRSPEGGMWTFREGQCLNCVRQATLGSWCKWCHPVQPEPWAWGFEPRP
jgi:hypothetical protein